MAKWGEGDPRWIVEERADAVNVNNWHWTEKNASQWSKDRMTELLTNLTIEDDKHFVQILKVTSINGEATANNRRGKLIFFYEWKVEADWEGQLKNSDNKTKYDGTLIIPYISEEVDVIDLDVEISVKSSSSDAYLLKEFFRKSGSKTIREQVALYLRDLKEEYSQTLILPTNQINGSTNCKPSIAAHVATPIQHVIVPPNSNNEDASEINAKIIASNVGVKIATSRVIVHEEFMCSAIELYQAFTDRDRLNAFTRSDVQCDSVPGGRFSLFGGSITGFFDELEAGKRLVMRWRHSNWPCEHYSKCSLTFEEIDSGTKLNVVQTGVPEREVENTRNGWRQYYFHAIKQTFAYGGRLF